MTAADKSTKAKEVGQRIAQARAEAGGMSQEELAVLVGLSKRSVQAHELGEVIPYKFLRDYERALAKPAAWLLHGDVAVVGREREFEELREILGDMKNTLSAIARHLGVGTA